MKKVTSCTRIIKFDSAHRVVGHESKCKHLHGHEYKAHITASANELDHLGRIIDFSVLKDTLGKFIDENLDHNLIIWADDPFIVHLFACSEGKKPYMVEFNPTAENIAAHLMDIGNFLLKDSGIKITKIILWETSNCYAEVTSV